MGASPVVSGHMALVPAPVVVDGIGVVGGPAVPDSQCLSLDFDPLVQQYRLTNVFTHEIRWLPRAPNDSYILGFDPDGDAFVTLLNKPTVPTKRCYHWLRALILLLISL